MAFTPFTEGERPSMANFNEKFQQAMAAATEAAFQVGDTLTTARIDLGDKWRLCNGAVFDTLDFPEFRATIAGYPVAKGIGTVNMSSQAGVGIAYYNGTWAIIGYTSDEYNYPYVYVSTNPFGSWTEKQISTTSNMYVRDIACYNGVWVICGNNSSNQPIIYTTTNPLGTWTLKTLSTTAVQLKAIACYEGTWVAIGTTPPFEYNGYIFSTTNPTGSWTMKQFDSEGLSIQYLSYYNGVITISSGSTSRFYVGTDPLGDFMKVELNGTATAIGDVAYYDGRWVMAARINNGSNIFDVSIYTTMDPFGEWVEKQILTSTSYYGSHIACYNGTWVFPLCETGTVTDNMTCITTDPLGEWTQEIYDDRLTGINAVAYHNNIWIASGSYESKMGCRVSNYAVLPTITQDKTYTYIKVKE